MIKYIVSSIFALFIIAFVIGQCNAEPTEYEYTEYGETYSEPSVNSEPSIEIKELPTEKETVPLANFPEIKNEKYEIPRFIDYRASQVLIKEGYTVSYNENTRNPNWVAWHLTSAHTSGEWSRKGISFMEDNEVKGEQQNNDAYRSTSLPIDHGHMCPAGDNKWSAKAMEQSFLLTNICPQNSNLNRGDWNELEEKCRGWARHYGEIWIVCGPIFYNESYTTIGNKIGVPDAFFKVVLRLGKKPKALGFIYPNEGTNHRMSYYVMSVDEVEEKTGIDFFYNLPDEIEDVVEANANINEW